MDPESESKSVGESPLPPSLLTTSQEELCGKLDDLHSLKGLKSKPSDMFRGAIFATRSELRSNPDWIAQAANSLRDILYPFKFSEAFKEYGSVRADQSFINEIGKIFGSLTELAHHGNGRGNSIDYPNFTASDFEHLLGRFEIVMLSMLTQQLDVHKEIDSIFYDEAPTTEVLSSSNINI